MLSAGRISLKVRTEVSDLSATGSVSLPISPTSAVVIPGVTVRRAETTVELPSGGAFVIVGLMQETTKRAASGLPWIQRVASFASGITRDRRAVGAAIAEPWSNGQTEGQITRLKLVKRQMYGRGNLDLLQARLVGAA